MSKRLMRRLCFSGGIMLLVLCQLNFPWVEDTEIYSTGEDVNKGEGYFGIAQDPWQWSTTQNWENGDSETLIRSARACGHPSMQVDVATTEAWESARFNLGNGSCEEVASGGQKSGYGIWGALMLSFSSSIMGYVGGRKAIRATNFLVVLMLISILFWWYLTFPFEQSYPEFDPLEGEGMTMQLEMELASGFWMAVAGTGLLFVQVLLMGPRKYH
tara:strand:+ start:267 stop:911 length:645 start_codon:yes stop_codon:yes gene_type:complete